MKNHIIFEIKDKKQMKTCIDILVGFLFENNIKCFDLGVHADIISLEIPTNTHNESLDMMTKFRKAGFDIYNFCTSERK